MNHVDRTYRPLTTTDLLRDLLYTPVYSVRPSLLWHVSVRQLFDSHLTYRSGILGSRFTKDMVKTTETPPFWLNQPLTIKSVLLPMANLSYPSLRTTKRILLFCTVKGHIYCVFTLVMDRIRNNNTDKYTMTFKFPVFGRENRACEYSVYQLGPFSRRRGLGTRLVCDLWCGFPLSKNLLCSILVNWCKRWFLRSAQGQSTQSCLCVQFQSGISESLHRADLSTGLFSVMPDITRVSFRKFFKGGGWGRQTVLLWSTDI